MWLILLVTCRLHCSTKLGLMPSYTPICRGVFVCSREGNSKSLTSFDTSYMLNIVSTTSAFVNGEDRVLMRHVPNTKTIFKCMEWFRTKDSILDSKRTRRVDVL